MSAFIVKVRTVTATFEFDALANSSCDAIIAALDQYDDALYVSAKPRGAA